MYANNEKWSYLFVRASTYSRLLPFNVLASFIRFRILIGLQIDFFFDESVSSSSFASLYSYRFYDYVFAVRLER